MKIKFIFFLFIIFTVHSLMALTPKEQKYFDAFTKVKRNINKTKEKHLKKFFPMIGLTQKHAEEVYQFTHSQNGIHDLNQLLQIKDITKDDIKILNQYFVANALDKGYTQDLSFDDIVSSVIDEENDTEDSEIKLTLEKYKNNPIDLNSATENELSVFPWLSPFMILKIIKYQKSPGFRTVEDLKKIEGFDNDMYAKTKPFVYVKPITLTLIEKQIKRKRTKKITGILDCRFLTSYPYSEEYLKKYYPHPVGLKEKLQLALLKYFNAGIVMERDIGENKLNDSQKLFLSYDNNKWYINKFIIGNYKLNFGQALTISDSGPAKSPSVLNVKNKGNNLKPDLSSYEDKNYFGLASQFQWNDFSLIAFFSKRKSTGIIEDWFTFGDGTDNTPDDDSDNVLSGYDPDSDGYHRTTAEEEKKNKDEKTLYGAHLNFDHINSDKAQKIKFGTTYYSATFNYPIMSQYNNDYFYKFRGKKIQQLGFDWDLVFSHINLYGEVSLSFHPDPLDYSIYSNTSKIGNGIVAGLLFTSKVYKSVLLFRSYDVNFFSFENSPFAENSRVNGETGVYSAHYLKLTKTTKLNTYFDIFSKSWRKYDETMPPFGYETFLSIEQKLPNKLIAYFQTKTENKEMKWSQGDESYNLWVNNDWRFRYELKWEANTKTKYRMRYETAVTKVPDLQIQYHSYMILGDIQYTLARTMTIYCRNIIFDGNYNAGIWEYENDIPAYMASTSFSGQGNRFYILIKQKLIPKTLELYFKTGATYFFRKYSFSPSLSELGTSEESSTDTLIGDTKYDFRLELIYKF